jgi:sigma-E factor negative regulatory protein RseB
MKGLFFTHFVSVTRLFTLALLSIGVVFISTLVSAQNEDSEWSKAEALLTKMSEALRNINYQGRFMYVVGNETSSFEVQHAVIDGKEYERLVFLNQKDQEVVRVGHDLFCVHPGNHLLRQHQEISTNPFADKLVKLRKGLHENYQLSVDEHQMVAGRDTLKVTFKSNDSNRYDHHLWIDEKSKLLLKANISDPTLGTLESFEYVQVTIGEQISKSVFEHKKFVRHSPKHFISGMPHTDSSIKANTKDVAVTRKWQATWLPKGFFFSGESLQDLKELKADRSSKAISNSKIEMLMFTDGIAAITVFVDTVKSDSKFNESSQMGALSAYTHSIKVDEQYFMITAVGEVQLQTVERVAKGVSFSKETQH